MRGFFEKLGFGSSGHETPEDPELLTELKRFERLKTSLVEVEKATKNLKNISSSFGKAVEKMGETLSNSMLWPDATCKDFAVFSLARNKHSIMNDTLGKQLMIMKKSLAQKIAYTKALDKGIQMHKKLKSKHDRVLHRIDVLKLKIKNGRADELAHIVDASVLDEHMQRKFHREFSELRQLENQKKTLIVELKEETRGMVAALRSSHTQMHRYCEQTSLSLEKAILSYLISSHKHVQQVSQSSDTSKQSKENPGTYTHDRKTENEVGIIRVNSDRAIIHNDTLCLSSSR